MVKLEATFRAAQGITPDLAAEIIQQAGKFDATTELQMGSTRVMLGSLIGILSLELRQGSVVQIIADGKDEESAAREICKLIEA